MSKYLLSLGLLIALNSQLSFSQDNHEPNQSEPSQLVDPFDPFDFGEPDSSVDNENKSAEELIREAATLLATERPLDARTKLLQALKKDPKQYRAHYLLAGYYMINVGHFRLSERYINQALALFTEKFGPPPYQETTVQLEHAQMLYYVSQVRLNLDDYQGALNALDDFTRQGYYDDWYPSTRAWVLMKLGKLDKAVRIARIGVFRGGEDGRSLNMLGILLSMVGERDQSLEVFRRAIAAELALGAEGNPATPLNNAGEVYKETFQEDRAESSWVRSLSLPDGCEHVLPTLNLVLLYLEELKVEAASKAIDDFEGCFAQFTLKNDEEHKALVQLARGRVAFHSGRIPQAIQLFENGLESIQWFGKIGTSQDDLRVAVTISLAQALDRRASMIRFERPESWAQWFELKREAMSDRFRSWWLFRRAREMLLEDLNDFEDLKIRNTDSMIEYPTLGEVIGGFPRGFAQARLEQEKNRDDRPLSKLYYDAYSVDVTDGWFSQAESLQKIQTLLRENVRPTYDLLLRVHLLTKKLGLFSESEKDYYDTAYALFSISPPHLRNSGFRLPVEFLGEEPELRSELENGPFRPSVGATCRVLYSGDKEKGFNLLFKCANDGTKTREVGDKSAAVVVNKLANAVFSEEYVKSTNSPSLF